jgi:hypothetical protein
MLRLAQEVWFAARTLIRWRSKVLVEKGFSLSEPARKPSRT